MLSKCWYNAGQRWAKELYGKVQGMVPVAAAHSGRTIKRRWETSGCRRACISTAPRMGCPMHDAALHFKRCAASFHAVLGKKVVWVGHRLLAICKKARQVKTEQRWPR